MPLDLNHLNDQQKKAVTHQGKPLLIIAGAGTGKTTVVSHKIAYTIDKEYAKPENILALTFTDKASHEMLERVESLIECAYTDMRISTFHGFCQWLLQNYGLEIGLPDHFKVLDNKASWMLIKDNFDAFKLDYFKPRANPYRMIHALIKHFSRCKDENITAEAYTQLVKSLKPRTNTPEEIQEIQKKQELAEAYKTYNSLLLQKGWMDFGDLLMHSVELLQKRPALKNELQKKFTHILVDEFQDTNWIQYELVRLLAGDRGFTAVADDDQSIYKFRGASIANVEQYTKDYPSAEKISLTTNYRSGQEILDVAHTFIQNNNPHRLEITQQINKKLKAGSTIQSSVKIIECETQKVEDEYIVKKIGAFEGARAVLCRTNAQVQHFAHVLRNAHIPIHIHANEGLFKETMIIECMSWFTLIADTKNDQACFRILNNQRMPCPPSGVETITQKAHQKKWSYVYTMQTIGKDEVSENTANWMHDLQEKINAHKTLMQETSVSGMAHMFFEEFGWFSYIARLGSSGNHAQAMQLVNTIQSFITELESFEETHEHIFVQNFLDYIALLKDAGYESTVTEQTEPEGCVQIMTMHASKGLEFDHVIIPQLVHLKFPSIKKREALAIPEELIKEHIPSGDMHLEEERRLMYVGITRAKQTLLCSYAKDYGGKTIRKPSRFIEELGVAVEAPDDSKTAQLSKKEPHNSPQTNAIHIPTKFSYTSLKSFNTCPLQFKFKYILNIPTRGAAPLSFGNAIHATLEQFYREIKLHSENTQASLFEEDIVEDGLLEVPSLKKLLELYQKNYIEDWFVSEAQKKEYRTHGEKILEQFYETQASMGWRLPKLIEQRIHIPVGEATLTGAIDRVDEEFGEFIIIDYKTGAPKSKKSLTKDEKLQLLLYTIGLEKTLGMKASRCEFWYLEDGTKHIFEPTDKDLEKALEEVEMRIHNIKKSDFTATPSPFVCSTCPFRDMCDQRV